MTIEIRRNTLNYLPFIGRNSEEDDLECDELFGYFLFADRALEQATRQ